RIGRDGAGRRRRTGARLRARGAPAHDEERQQCRESSEQDRLPPRAHAPDHGFLTEEVDDTPRSGRISGGPFRSSEKYVATTVRAWIAPGTSPFCASEISRTTIHRGPVSKRS